jgi:NAD-dependent dihydropyrimidine dehydrogenase PreA subunit
MIINIDTEKCIGCKHCYEVCPLDIYTWNEELKRPIIAYEEECQMCFVCQEECQVDALRIKIPIAFW